MAGAVTGLDYASAIALLVPMPAAIAGPLLQAAEAGALAGFADTRQEPGEEG